MFEKEIAKLLSSLEYGSVRFILGCVFIVFFFWLHGFTRRLIQKKLAVRLANNSNVLVLITRTTSVLIIFIGILVTCNLMIPNFSLTNIVNLLSVGSIAISFAFKDILQNFLAGSLLLIEKPFNIGDYVYTSDLEGTIKDIRIRATILKTSEGHMLVVPNSMLFSNPVKVKNAYMLTKITKKFGIESCADIATILKLIEQTIKDSGSTNKNVHPKVEIIELQQDSVIIQIAWWVEHKKISTSHSTTEVLLNINQLLQEHKIKINYPPLITTVTS